MLVCFLQAHNGKYQAEYRDKKRQDKSDKRIRIAACARPLLRKTRLLLRLLLLLLRRLFILRLPDRIAERIGLSVVGLCQCVHIAAVRAKLVVVLNLISALVAEHTPLHLRIETVYIIHFMKEFVNLCDTL